MFAGRRFDIEIGLYYNRARYYNPYTGRFLQTDPSGYSDGMNWYAYCGSNPLNCTDPTGLYADTNNTDDANGSEDTYNPYVTDCYMFISQLLELAQDYEDRFKSNSKERKEASKEIVNSFVPRKHSVIRSLIGRGGHVGNYYQPPGHSGFRTALTQGGQNNQVYQHVACAAAFTLRGRNSGLDFMNYLDRKQLQEAIEKGDTQATLQKRAELYDNEAGRLIGNAMGEFFDGNINLKGLQRQLIGILGDDRMLEYFGIRQTRLYIKEK